EEARKECQQALELSEKVGSQPHRGSAHRALGTVIARKKPSVGDEDRALADDHFRSAVELLGEVGAEPELMRAFREYGDFLAEIGDADGAATVRERADEILSRLRESARVTVDVDV